MGTAADQISDGLSFGPFTLIVGERLLKKEGVPVEIGSRALEILIALISRPNELVSKNELMSQVWPGVFVDEGNLRAHIASLRKALGDGLDGARFIATMPGRGYRWVAPVSRNRNPRNDGSSVGTPQSQQANLPARLSGMVGRTDEVLRLSEQLSVSRLVTIVGAGGIGKTTVAI